MPRVAKPTEKWAPRFTISVTPEQYWKIKNHLPYGMQRALFNIIIDDMIKMIDTYGEHFIIALLQKEISYRTIMERYQKGEFNNGATTGFETQRDSPDDSGGSTGDDHGHKISEKGAT